MNIQKISSWKEVKWKLVSVAASLKVQVWVVTSLFLLAGMITATEWVAVTVIVLGGRIAQAYTDSRNGNGETHERDIE